MTEYCTGCKQKLPLKVLGGIMGNKVYEFEDGNYCQKCAEIKVERDREDL